MTKRAALARLSFRHSLMRRRKSLLQRFIGRNVAVELFVGNVSQYALGSYLISQASTDLYWRTILDLRLTVSFPSARRSAVSKTELRCKAHSASTYPRVPRSSCGLLLEI